MSPEQRAELRRLLAEATKPPWRINERRPAKGWWLSAHGWQMFAEVYGNLDKEFHKQGRTNAALIAAAINALPALLDAAEERDRLRAERDAALRERDEARAAERRWAAGVVERLRQKWASEPVVREADPNYCVDQALIALSVMLAAGPQPGEGG